MQINSVLAKQKKNRITILLLAIGIFILTLISLFVGQYGMSFIDTIKSVLGIAKEQDATVIRSIILNIRLPRTLAAISIGGSLAVAGLTYQCVFRNNLASQDILGVSTSSCVGAALGIVLGLTTAHIQILAFAMGILNVVLVFLLASRVKLDKTLSLILSGILIGGVMSSVLAFIKYIANPQTQLQAIVFWTMGDISSITYDQLLFVAIPIIASLVILFLKRWGLNYFCYNDSEAKSLGVNITRDRIIYLGCATVLVASSVSIAGSIGWIGLVIPQLVRLIVGNDNKYNLPLSFFMGSSFLLIVDIINRMISAAELPVSILTGIIGLPVFVVCWLINAKSRKENEI